MLKLTKISIQNLIIYLVIAVLLAVVVWRVFLVQQSTSNSISPNRPQAKGSAIVIPPKESVFYCLNKNEWIIPPNMQEGTPSPVCNQSKLQLQQISPRADHYAEVDLKSVNNRPYNQTSFMLKVSLTFIQEDVYTYGCLIVQTPAGSPGGYIICINDRGAWQLQDATDITRPVKSGNINTKLAQKINFTMMVQSGLLSYSINGQNMPSINENSSHISSDGQIGLIVEKTDATQSAPVIYTDFGLAAISN